MRRRIGVIVAAVCALVLVVGAVALSRGDSDPEPATLPPGCSPASGQDGAVCHLGPSGTQATDPQALDVLVLAPDSASADRELDLVTQVIEIWKSNVATLAGEPGFAWLGKLDVQVESRKLGDQPLTYEVTDPEVVVVITDPVIGLGAGAPTRGAHLAISDADGSTCLEEDAPFTNATWSSRSDFDNHHEPHTGTTVAECGSDGPTCFTVLGDLGASGSAGAFATFDLINHEFSHCITLAHGDPVSDPASPPSTSGSAG